MMDTNHQQQEHERAAAPDRKEEKTEFLPAVAPSSATASLDALPLSPMSMEASASSRHYASPSPVGPAAHQHQHHQSSVNDWNDHYELLRPLRLEDTAHAPCQHQHPYSNHNKTTPAAPILPCRYKPTGELRAVKIIKKSRWTHHDQRLSTQTTTTTSVRDSSTSSPSSSPTTTNHHPHHHHHDTTRDSLSSTISSRHSGSPQVRPSTEVPRLPSRSSHYRNHWNRSHLQEFTMMKALQQYSCPHMLQVYELLEDSHYYYMIVEAAATNLPPQPHVPQPHVPQPHVPQHEHVPQFINLRKALKQRGQFSEPEVAVMMTQILKVVQSCHQRQIVLCDLKLDSFLIHQEDDDDDHRIIDGGDLPSIQLKLQTMEHAVLLSDLSPTTVADQAAQSLSQFASPLPNHHNFDITDNAPPTQRNRLRLVEPRGRPRYMAPEVVAHDKTYGFACDVWSAGIICFVLLAGNFPLDATRSHDIQERILHTLQQSQHGPPHQWLWDIMDGNNTAWTKRSEDCRRFVACLLTSQEPQRATAHAALHHPWLRRMMGRHEMEEYDAGPREPPRFSSRASTVDSVQARASMDEKLLQSPAEGFTQLDRDMHAILEASQSYNDMQQQQQQHQQALDQPSLAEDDGQNAPELPPPQDWSLQPRTSTWPRPADELRQSQSLQQQFRAIENFIVTHYQIRNERTLIRDLLESIGIQVVDDSSPTLTKDNVRVAYSHLFKRQLEPEELENVFAQLDTNQTGRISFMEFVVAVMNEKEILFSRDLLDSFNVFDVHRTGLVSTAYLVHALKSFWENSKVMDNINPEDRVAVHAMMVQVMANEDTGEKDIDLEEFVAILLETAFVDDLGLIDATPISEEEKASSDPYYNSPSKSFDSMTSGQSLTYATSSGSANLASAKDQQRRSTLSILDRLSLKFSAANFIAQRRGRLTHHYHIEEFINEGGCGAIWLCRHKETGDERAVKVVKRAPAWVGDDRFEADQKLLREFHILRNLDHPNILRMYELFADSACYYIVMDLAKGGDLCDELDEYGAFVEAEAARLMKQLLSCVNYFHGKHIVHCDLKPENILLEDNHELSQLKIIDFGFAANLLEHKGGRLTKRWGTLPYSAPELLYGNYGAKVDVWALGVIAFLLLSDEFPFFGRSREETTKKICQGSFSLESPIWEEVSDDAQDFVSQMLQVNEEKRPTAAEALGHPWIEAISQRSSHTFRRYGGVMVAHVLQNLARFQCRNKLQRATYAFIASQLVTKRERQVIDEVFRAIDTKSDGKVGKVELMAAWQEYLGKELTNQEAESIIDRCDVGSTGFIDYSEFLVAASDKDHILSHGNLEKAFHAFDADKNGYITKENLKEVLASALSGDERVDNAALDKMLREATICHHKRVCFEEFVAIMRDEVQEHDHDCQGPSSANSV